MVNKVRNLDGGGWMKISSGKLLLGDIQMEERNGSDPVEYTSASDLLSSRVKEV
jgi:hypothetical protein